MSCSLVSGPGQVRAGALALVSLLATSAFAATTTLPPQLLVFQTSAQVYGQLSNGSLDPDFGTTVYSYVNGDGDSKNYYIAPSYSYGTANELASVSWSRGGGNDPASHGPLFNTFTGNDAYSFGYTGNSQVLGTDVKAIVSSTSTDLASATGTTVNAWGYAQWQDQWLIAATPDHAAGTFGRLNLSYTLEGLPSGDNAQAQLYVSTSFTDTLGANNSSSSQISAYSGDASWTGSNTVTANLLYEYGTAFNVNFNLYTYVANNSTSDFYDTGAITAVELPLGTVLQTGALQSGIGGVSYGHVFNSNNPDLYVGGGGLPVPEPETYALMLLGLGALNLWRRRGAAR
jgi:hypothetical protein